MITLQREANAGSSASLATFASVGMTTRSHCTLGDVGGANVVCRKQREEGRAFAGGFDGRAAFGFLAFDEADGGDDLHAGGFGGFDGGDGGGSGGADVVDDEDRGSGFGEAFDAAGGAVRFFGFADEESMNERRAGLLLSAGGAGDGDGGDYGVGSQGEATYGCGVELVLGQQVEDSEAGEARTLGVEGGDSAVDVVVALAA